MHPETPPKQSSTADDTVAKFLEAQYQPKLQALILRFSTLQPNEKGFFIAATENMNRLLGRFNLSVPWQMAHDLYSGRKTRKNGVGLSLAYRLGVALTGKSEPDKAIALFYLWVCGLWKATPKDTADKVLKRIGDCNRMDEKELRDRLAAQDAKLDMILQSLTGKAGEQIPFAKVVYHPLVAELRKLSKSSDADIETAAKEVFKDYPSVAKSLTELLIVGSLPPVREHWLNLTYLMHRLTGEMWPPNKIEDLAKKFCPDYPACGGSVESQPSSSGFGAVEPK